MSNDGGSAAGVAEREGVTMCSTERACASVCPVFSAGRACMTLDEFVLLHASKG